MGADWLIEPRGPDGVRDGRPIRLFSHLVVIDRYLKPGSWQLDGPAKYLSPLLVPGMGVVLSRSGQQIMSGQVTQWSLTGDGNASVIGWDDKVWLGGGPDDNTGRILFPNPTQPITAQTAQSGTLTGIREDLIVNMLSANVGATALTSRRVPRLVVPTSLHRGGSTTVTTKLDLMHQVIPVLAEASGLDVDVVHSEVTGTPLLLVQITPVADVSDRVRFGPPDQGGAGVLGTDWTYTTSAPTMTDAVVGGTRPPPAVFGDSGDITGDDENTPGVDLRLYRAVADSSSAAAAWVRRPEGFVDASNTNTAAELDQAGLTALIATTERREFSGTLVDSVSVKYGRDWLCGYKVGVTIAGTEFADVVREVKTEVQSQQGQQTEQVSAAVGWSQARVPGTTSPAKQLAGLAFRQAVKIAVWN